MPAEHYDWTKITMNGGRVFYMKSTQFDERVSNQVGQYGMRLFMPTDRLFYERSAETAEKLTLKEVDTFGFNPNFIETVDIVKGKEVEVK